MGKRNCAPCWRYTKVMSGAISQMQMVYNAEEDRILFRVNTTDKSEFRFWVTRRYAMMLLKVLRDHVQADPDLSHLPTSQDQQAVKEFKREQAMGDANFEKKFEEQPSHYPLGSEARLAFKLTFSFRDDGSLQLSVQPKEGQGINVVINQQINLTLTELILAASRKGDWKLDEWLKQVPATEQEQRVIN